MKQRSISAIGVAIVGLLPAILGGPVLGDRFRDPVYAGYDRVSGDGPANFTGVFVVRLPGRSTFRAVAWFDCPEYAAAGICRSGDFSAALRNDTAGAIWMAQSLTGHWGRRHALSWSPRVCRGGPASASWRSRCVVDHESGGRSFVLDGMPFPAVLPGSFPSS